MASTRSVGVVAAAGVTSAAAWWRRKDVVDVAECALRSVGVASATVATVVDYRTAAPESMAAAHDRGARRFRALADSHGGIFVKLGQHVASLNRAVPEAYVEHLSSLRDAARASDPAAVRRAIEAEFRGAFPFREWSTEPIASASIAQVHAATTFDGARVAVKVIHPGLERKIRLDLWALRACAAFAELTLAEGAEGPEAEEERRRIRSLARGGEEDGGPMKDMDDHVYSWVLPDFEAALQHELDLVQEATVMERCRWLLGALHDCDSDDLVRVRVPTVHWDLTTRRVLTTDLVEGARRVDETPLDVRRRVASILVKAHAFLMLQCGIVHADPHGANAIIVDRPGAAASFFGAGGGPRYELFILDFGLCRVLEHRFRRGLCGLWRALATRQKAAVEKYAVEVGIDPAMTQLLFASADRTRPLGTPPDVDKLRRELEKRFSSSFDAVSMYMATLPRDVLFILRSTSLLRSLTREMGLNSRERYIAFALEATRGACIPLDPDAARDHAIDHIPSLVRFNADHPETPARRVLQPEAKLNISVDAEIFVRKATALQRCAYRLRVFREVVHFALDFSIIEGYIRAKLFFKRNFLGVDPLAKAIPAENRV